MISNDITFLDLSFYIFLFAMVVLVKVQGIQPPFLAYNMVEIFYKLKNKLESNDEDQYNNCQLTLSFRRSGPEYLKKSRAKNS